MRWVSPKGSALADPGSEMFRDLSAESLSPLQFHPIIKAGMRTFAAADTSVANADKTVIRQLERNG